MRNRLQEIRDAIAAIPQANIQSPLNMLVDYLSDIEDGQTHHVVMDLSTALTGHRSAFLPDDKGKAHDKSECSTPDVKKQEETPDADQKQVSQKD